MRKSCFIATLLYLFGHVAAASQQLQRLVSGLEYQVAAEVTSSSGDNTPLWLSANKYGLGSLNLQNGYLRGSVERPVAVDSLRRWGVGYGADVALAYGFTSTLMVQQAFVEARWLKGLLTVGAKEQPMMLKNQQLSSGSQTLGKNARPVPQVRVSLPDYWIIPGTHGWLSFKGQLAYGRPTDDCWQKDFTHKQKLYTESTLYHEKAGYFRIGPKNITLEAGLEMATQFGGRTYYYEGKKQVCVENDSRLGAYFRALFPSGGEVVEENYRNAEGNHVGSWVARLNFDYPKWNLGVYADHYFEDHSSMLFLDYDGYGQGAEWDEKKDNRFFLYELKDIMLGAELKLKQWDWVNNIVVEFLTTKYQGGPVYHDHALNNSDHISGRDDYYNHYIFTGWQHWGMVMGNPLYRSPIYNDDNRIKVKNNRFIAWHLGLGGKPIDGLSYRLLATIQKGWGTYYDMYPDPKHNVSILAEAQYRFRQSSPLHNWTVRGAFGMDRGGIYGDNTGLQLTVLRAFGR